MKYNSWSGSLTLSQAIKRLGKDHVIYLVNHPRWQEEIRFRVRGAWLCNDSFNHAAYCALMQAGQGLTAQAISG